MHVNTVKAYILKEILCVASSFRKWPR